MNYSKFASFLAFGLGLLAAPTVQARPQMDGVGLVTADQSMAIVNLGPSLESGKYTYYQLQNNDQRIGTVQIFNQNKKLASGTFEEFSLDGSQGCRGRLTLEVTTPGTARTQEVRWNASWEVEEAISGKQCDRVGQSLLQTGIRRGRLPQSTLRLATRLEEGTLTAKHVQAQINLRDRSQLSAKIQHQAKVGDRIRIIDSQFGSDEYLWYHVEIANSGATGWVRGDLVSPDLAHL